MTRVTRLRCSETICKDNFILTFKISDTLFRISKLILYKWHISDFFGRRQTIIYNIILLFLGVSAGFYYLIDNDKKLIVL